MPKAQQLRAPFSYFGGKSRVAPAIWAGLGDPGLYVEPFLGSAAALLARPSTPRREIVNDKDGYITNWWRAAKLGRKTLAEHVRWPINEIDLQARHRWLCTADRKASFLEHMRRDPAFFDPVVAAWWCWGMCCWMGGGWCGGVWHPDQPDRSTGTGLKSPKHARLKPEGVVARDLDVDGLLSRLESRLTHAVVLCGDWSKCFYDSDLIQADVGIFLDPPYDFSVGRDCAIYREEMSSTKDVQAFCRQWGRRRNIRIVLAGFEGEYRLPGWKCMKWKRPGGLARTEQARRNAWRERLWFSPHCHPVDKSLLPWSAPEDVLAPASSR